MLKRFASGGVPLRAQFLFGSCLLTGAALLPHAPLRPVLAGMALAALIQYIWFRLTFRRGSGK